MQKSFCLFLLTLFSWSMLAPVFPVFEYFINYDYIVEVLCINKNEPELECDGKCYLKDQLSANSIIKNDTSENQLVDYRFKPVPLFFQDTGKIHLSSSFNQQSKLLVFYTSVSTEYLAEIPSRPPRFSLLFV
ncbi:hypothetical protein [Christiangramia portivictoriae]|uniref:hypothetical protein n=1 Tax=Christiangramia portivictoriae TaxID=326069 RepID=UPI0004043682|nr:hypothetical protein [Christiangramia portivictoriae]